ncbi:MAG TPA: PKD domain-containing protein [Micromonosporaceae bacterium]|nr:PKD domain-containing protein [Micromonosporaceae bacterium]
MNAHSTSRPRRWLVAAGCVAAALPMCLTASGTASAGPPWDPAATAPTIDADYLYTQFYTMAKSFSYRISGADGDPRNAADPFNVPPTVNGWTELVAYWKANLTDRRLNTQLAGFATVTDHYFRRTGGYRFDSNDAEVTIPGASCAGQRVLLSAHPDETPVPTDIVGLIDSGTTSGTTGFGAARRHITGSNLGNEGAYDGLSGVALTMAEYHALLDWYHATGTYPKRTLKVTLLDASRGKTGTGLFGREGSAYYANSLIPSGPQGQYVLFANMDSLGINYPAYHLGTEFFWNNVAGGGVGPWFTFIKATPTAPNLAYPDTGAGSPGANIAANSPAIGQLRTDLQAAILAGFDQQGAKYNFSVPLENPLRYNQTGQAPNPYSGVVPTKPAYLASDQALFSPVRDDLDALEDEQAFFDKGIPGFTVSGVKSSNADENPYGPSVAGTTKATPVIGYAGNQTTFQLGNTTPQPGITTTADATAAGDITLKVAAVTNLTAGQPIFIGTGTDIEYGQIQSVGTAGPTGTGVTLVAPLTRAHPSGVPFNVNENQPVGFLSDSIEHLNYFAGGAPHGLRPEQPTEELKRALELPAQWTSLLLADNNYLGAIAHPDKPVAYFETTPARPDTTLTVTFDAGFSRDAAGSTNGLKYYWDFGDGTHAVGARVTHTYSGATYADVKLAVRKGNDWGLYRQAVAVDSPADGPPPTDACGTFSADDSARLIAAAKKGTDQS